MATVRAENLYKVFGRKPDAGVRRLRDGATRDELLAEGVTAAVIDASFEAKEGETFVVMGLSGSGKSTLIRMLNGILPATSGSVYVGDDDVTQLSPKALRSLRSQKMSMVFQHFALFPHRTVLDNAAYGLQVRGEDRDARRDKASEALSTVGLKGWDDSYPDQLSGGMKQRVGLARALATDTDVMLMDEAFSALDPLIRREMQDQLVELQQRLHKTVIFITHDLNEAMKLGDRIAMMRNGRIVQIGTAKEFLNEPANDYVASFVEDVDRSRVLTASTVMTDAVAVRGDDNVRVAEATAHENAAAGVFVVDSSRKLLGALSAAEIADASRRGDTRGCADLAASDVTSTRPDELLVNLTSRASAAALPLAVVDDERHVLGMVSQATMLGALGGSDNGSAEAEAHGTGDSTQRADAAAPSAARVVTGEV